ncbi:MAG: beta-propeller fold lactonase family protein, partial [Nesterenkonia sp.]|nr:beta-propeller fold lactonase family protein [Nesterenkonia sp.]
ASAETRMSHAETVTGDISPKSVVASGDGTVIANNMMYRHTVTLYDAESRELTQTLDDTVDAGDFDVEDVSGEITGAPVEAVWTSDGQYAYVSQYQLTGVGAPAEDDCASGEAIAESVVYRYSVEEEDWDQVIEVGRVPKYVALSPDDSTLLVSNWCDRSLSVVDTETARETEQIPLNSMPRGIVVLPDQTTAYVTAMYADEVYRVDLDSGESEVAFTTGERPRHLVLDESGEAMYLTVAGADRLLKIDPASGEVVDEVTTGQEPRSMAISADGTALYVVNYDEDTVSKFDAETMEEIQRETTGGMPVGVTYEPTTETVWVADYAGSLTVFDDTGEGEDEAEEEAADEDED